MLGLFTVLYMCIFSFLTNCYILIYKNVLVTGICIAIFLVLNGLIGLFTLKTKSKKLKLLYHGTVLLMSFCLSLVVSVTINILLLTKYIPSTRSILIGNIVYSIITNFILFWNGIICVYLTSVQLGIKTRVVGIICGLIPIVNLIVLGIIIHKTYSEVLFEYKKEMLNFKRKANKFCKTKYPLFLVHGVFFRDFKHLNYWGRIPDELEANGAICYYGNHQSALSVKESGEELAKRIKEITKQTGCGKVNIIAHSKGGLDCRYALKNSDILDYVASLTTINTPHRGCLFADWLLEKAPQDLKTNIAASYNKSAKLLGDKNPDFLAAVNDLTAEFCKKFDKQTPYPKNIFCQSVGSVMHKASSGKFPLNLSHNFVKLFDGENDGLVGVNSFEWGSKYTLLNKPLKRGISHGDMIDLNRENIPGFDIREFYVQLVKDLKKRGL